MKLQTLVCFFAAYIETVFGVKCYVGTDETTFLMDCGAASDKCVKSKMNNLIGRVCYSQMDWSRFPTFHPTVGCQKSSEAEMSTEICICIGDKCNDGDFEQSESTTKKLLHFPTAKLHVAPTHLAPQSTTQSHVGLGVHQTSTTKLMLHRHKGKHLVDTVSPSSTSTTDSGVSCYVGVGEHTYLLRCGGSSDKCVKSRVNDVVAKVCYNQMDWSKYPLFDPRVGCQKFNEFGTEVEICICIGDRCNEGGFHEINDLITTTTASTTEAERSNGVTCDVGVGSTTFAMDCGTSSDKCVWSSVNDVVAKVCYSHMKWSMYPTFDPRLGCQEQTAYGMHSKICICTGDRCNRQEPGIIPTRIARSVEHTTSGCGTMYTIPILTVFMLVIVGYILQ